MLFLTDSILDTRRRLAKGIERGKLTDVHAFERALELDPDDHIALQQLGHRRLEAGDSAGAEEYFWRAVAAQPCLWPRYLDLARLYSERPGQTALSMGLSELAFRKLALDDESLEHMESLPGLAEAPGELKDLSKAEQVSAVAEALRRRRDLEPAAVTARLRPFRLVNELQEQGCIDASLVDALVEEGAAVVPLLVGVLRGWAQELLPDDDECTMENTLALLGESGDAAVIPHLLEFITRDNATLSGAAGWAFDRIVELHPDRAAEVIAEIASHLDVPGRIAVTERLLRFPKLAPMEAHRPRLAAPDESSSSADWPPDARPLCASSMDVLLARLAENLEDAPKEDRNQYLPLLVSAMIFTRRRAGLAQARSVLRQTSALLGRQARAECDAMIEAFSGGDIPAPPELPASEWTVYDICAGNAFWEEDEEESEEEDEADLAPVEPVRKKPAPGRNDPCWCGSGKKYKKCHEEADRKGGDGPAPAGRNEFDSLRGRIGKMLADVISKAESRAALEEFYGGDDPGPNGEMPFIDWMVHDWVSPRLGRTVVGEFLRRHGSGLTPREREIVESWSRSYVGLYEVRDVREGSGIEVKDLVSDRVFFVHDVSMSKRLVRWDGLLARVVPGERGSEFTGVGVSVPRQQLEPMRQWMEEDRERTGLPWPEYLKRNLSRIRRQPEELYGEWRDSIQLTNTDGEELLWSKAVYRVLDEPAVAVALNACPELEEDGGRYTWLRGAAGEEGRTVLGNIRIARGELVFECNSKQRAKRGKEMLAHLAGPLLEHIRDEFTTQQELKRRAAEEPPPAKPASEEIPPEVQRRLIAQVMERHFAKWPDTPLPALKGKTPRQAVKTAVGRRRVAELLRDFENAEAHRRREGEAWYDVDRLRAELGLER